MSKKENNINIKVGLDANLIPENIRWSSSDTEKESLAKAFLLSIWDEKEANTLKIDLWTKDMSIEEMSKFYFQTFLTMADTFEKATSEDQVALAMRDFAEFFGEKMGVIQPTGKFDK